MNNTITCLACRVPEIFKDDISYHEHLLKAHGATSSDQAMLNERAKEKNTPKDLPPGIPQEALPTPEFLEAIKRIEEKPKTPPSIELLTKIPTMELKPIVLSYSYNGNCPSCSFPVKTIMLNVGKRLFAVAFCNSCNKEIKTIEVKPIKEDK